MSDTAETNEIAESTHYDRRAFMSYFTSIGLGATIAYWTTTAVVVGCVAALAITSVSR